MHCKVARCTNDRVLGRYIIGVEVEATDYVVSQASFNVTLGQRDDNTTDTARTRERLFALYVSILVLSSRLVFPRLNGYSL